MEARHWVLMVTEHRRISQMGYKADITVLSGLDEGDMRAIDKCFKSIENSCQLDKEDGRFVLRGSAFNSMAVLNTLTEQRNYRVEFNPQQHNIPLKQGNMDDKFAFIYHLSKPSRYRQDNSESSDSEQPTQTSKKTVKLVTET